MFLIDKFRSMSNYESPTLDDVLKRGKNNLDLIRIVMAVMVIFGHSYALSLQPHGPEPLSYFFPFTYSAATAVKVFFFISGLLVTNSIISSQSCMKFIIARFFRIYPAFFVIIIITGLIIAPMAFNGNIVEYYRRGLFIDYIFNSLLMSLRFFIDGVFVGNGDHGSLNGSLWTIPIEISAYLVVLSVFMLGAFKNRVISSVICVAVIALPLSNIEGFNFIIDKSSEAYLLPSCFALGSLLAINKDIVKVDIKIPVAFFLLYKVSYSLHFSHFCFFAGVSTLLLYISTTTLARSLHIKKDVSYGIYLWAFPVQQLIIYYISPGPLMIFLLSTSIVVLLSLLSFIFIEKPSMEFGRKVAKRL